MKNLLFLVVTLFSFSLFFSCGEENFDAYDTGSSAQNLTLLPSEITKSFINEETGTSYAYQILLDYDSKNRLSSIQETLTGGYKNTYEIKYDIDGNVSEVVENSASSGTIKYTYEYISDYSILEHVTAGANTRTNTLTLNAAKQLISKDDAESGTITYYKYDSSGNLTSENSNSYTYDSTKGWMSSVQTPHWLFYSFEGDFPGTYNLVNNVTTNMDGEDYIYTEFNLSKYPVKITMGDDEEITIKYSSAK